MTCHEIDFNCIPQLSFKDTAYQKQDAKYDGFYKYDVHIDSFRQIIEERSKFSIDRKLLVEVLSAQYAKVDSSQKVHDQLALLSKDTTFTITTAHQPVLLLGPLYIVYKILSTINLCRALKSKYPEYDFVPMFITGGEDHDFDEVATVHLFNESYTWSTKQDGPVGRMETDGLSDVIEQVILKMGKSDHAKELSKTLRENLELSGNYAEFNFRLVNFLFGEMGLVVLNMDDTSLKQRFLPYALRELKENLSVKIVRSTQQNLQQKGIDEQAHVRDVNLFFISQNQRYRIIANKEGYDIGPKYYTGKEIEDLFCSQPGEISPNVVMRPIFQEIILPNLAYIGGGGEIAYWLERLEQFEAFGVPFPMLIRRNSALIISRQLKRTIDKLGLSNDTFFKTKDEIIKAYLFIHSNEDYSLIEEIKEFQEFFKKLSQKAKSVDQTLEQFTLAEGAKQAKVLKSISSKITKAAKQKNELALQRINKTKDYLFPKGKLQERTDNFIPFYLEHGKKWFHDILEVMDPMNKNFLVLEEH